MKKENALILTGGLLEEGNAKTAHGLIRNSSRFEVVAIVDSQSAGKEAGTLLDGRDRGIRVYGTVTDFVAAATELPRYAVVGVALGGGRFTKSLLDDIREAIKAGMSIVSGLHQFLVDIPEIHSLAEMHGVELVDIRKPRPKDQLKFWTGEIYKVKTPVIGVLGTDCALGKRTTAVMITEEMRSRGNSAFMIFTGQTGWLQGHQYGFILDSTYNDFISGELENAVVTCASEQNPDVIFLEGQSALSNPSGPCGAEYLLSAQCKGIILQHAPARIYFHGQEDLGFKISIDRDMAIINQYGSEVIAIALNTEGLTYDQAKAYRDEYEARYGLPVVLPIEEGVAKLGDAVLQWIEKRKTEKPTVAA